MRNSIDSLPLKKLEQVCDECQRAFWSNCLMASNRRRAEKSAPAEQDLSLEELFAQHAEELKLTRQKVQMIMKERSARIRQRLLAEYGLVEDTLEGAPEETKSELASKLMHELAHSIDAKIEHGLYNAADAREKRMSVSQKADEILSTHRSRALNVSIPEKLAASVRHRSTILYHSELKDHFRSKYIEQIEKSELLLPEFKAAAKAGEEPNMPNLYEVANEMSVKLTHPEAFGQVLAERHTSRQALQKYRIEKLRNFFFRDLPQGFRGFFRLLPFVIPLAAAMIFQDELERIDKRAHHFLSYSLLAIAACAGLYAMSTTTNEKTHQTERKQIIAVGIFIVLLVIYGVIS